MDTHKKNFRMAVLWLLILLLCLFAAVANAAPTGIHPKKIAVVLSGGGAKGAAHIGVLKVLEETGVYPDYVVGTSMGAIIGGLYSIGYTASELDSLVRTQDWIWLLSDKPKRTDCTLKELENENRYVFSFPLKREDNTHGRDGLVRGQNISNLFSALTVGYHDSICFSRLPVPFACVATDITDGSEVVLDCGVLAEAMRSSMAIPGVFSPVRKDSMILVDGGLVNNFPVDVARRMGADIVIGVDVQDGLHDREDLNSLSEIVSQIIDIACRNKYEQNRSQTDIYIKVDVEGYTAASFTSQAVDTLVRRGYTAASQQRDRLESMSVFSRPQKISVGRQSSSKQIRVSTIAFTGNGNAADHERMVRKCGLAEYSTIGMGQIEYALTTLRNELDYPYVTYRLQQDTKDTYRLVFQLESEKRTTLDFGVRFDTEEVVSLLVNASAELSTLTPSVLSITGKLGKQYMARLQYTIKALQMHDFNFSYTYNYRDIDICREGDRICNATYNHHELEVDYTSMRFRNFRYKFGVGFELYHNPSLLYKTAQTSPLKDSPSAHFFKYFLQADYNTQDRNYFPSRGIKFRVNGSAYTDNMIRYEGDTPFYAVSGMFAAALPLNRRFTLEPAVYGRLLDGKNVPYFYANALGGEYPSKYFPQQLPFTGIGKVELADAALLAGYTKIRCHVSGRHYVSLTGNVAVSNTRLYNLFSGEFIYGIGLGYGFDSKFGPLEASVGYSNRTENVKCHINLGYYF